MAEYDLTMRMVQSLDRQLVYPLLDFVSSKEVYKAEDILRAKFELLSHTNMVDFTGQLYEQIHGTAELPAEFATKREEVIQKLEEGEQKTEHIREVIENPEVAGLLRQDKLQNMKLLRDNYQCTPEMVLELYNYGQLQYSCGNYGGSADMLFHFSILSTDPELTLSAMWGKLASEILLGNWEVAYEDMFKLRETIDKAHFKDQSELLQQRSWLLHWSLFVFFNHAKGRDGIVDTFLLPQYISTIQNSCPWILRYLTAAVVTNRRRRNMMQELVKIIEQVSHSYRDPVTEFVEALYVDFDFDRAAAKLEQCEDVLKKDFFLTVAFDDFVENARFFFAEVYCRIHKRIDLAGLTRRLNMKQEEGEKWIVKLIRDTRMDAKVDFKDNSVIMNPTYNPVYQQVIERTKALVFRSHVLNGAIDKRSKSAGKDENNQEQKPYQKQQQQKPTKRQQPDTAVPVAAQ
ncbi:eukaryotic translation initiation factor 3 subunit E [Coemansia aciculifera]|uniref:Eukaryotic translation initiation factor 3 subunit E n=2 Tax=Coemansia TaxID=4863 RepID=A0A9W8GY98_9FUNG|nr:eukaryotic translation initiation factor 3 subunit E [Coemansia pectinata]KAJ2863711.1 eukaryotic translation initiation factor 3 subunit E [Coemansia aciculifera]KAJ2873407.1 eukaryotic translation initiation factor 3 subunit E [Coemansia aciculifera]KAJ2883131.1 eukaryotic translation initiation factor 3 subunit E [Coemansia aciculifera]